MLPEHAVVLDPNDIICVVRVIFLKMQQYFQLHSRLVLELLLVSDNLDRNNFSSFVIDTFESLPEGALAQKVDDLESIGYLIL